MGYITLGENEQALIFNQRGQSRLVEGPQRVIRRPRAMYNHMAMAVVLALRLMHGYDPSKAVMVVCGAFPLCRYGRQLMSRLST